MFLKGPKAKAFIPREVLLGSWGVFKEKGLCGGVLLYGCSSEGPSGTPRFLICILVITSNFAPSLSPFTVYFFTVGSKVTKPTSYRLNYAQEILLG